MQDDEAPAEPQEVREARGKLQGYKIQGNGAVEKGTENNTGFSSPFAYTTKSKKPYGKQQRYSTSKARTVDASKPRHEKSFAAHLEDSGIVVNEAQDDGETNQKMTTVDTGLGTLEVHNEERIATWGGVGEDGSGILAEENVDTVSKGMI